MNRLLSIFRREPAPLRCTPDNLHAAGLSYDCIARSEQYWHEQPPAPDDIARRGEGYTQ